MALTRRPQASLLEYLDLSQLNCLNEAPQHTLKSIVADKKKNTGSAHVLSDADEQLLLNIPVSPRSPPARPPRPPAHSSLNHDAAAAARSSTRR